MKCDSCNKTVEDPKSENDQCEHCGATLICESRTIKADHPSLILPFSGVRIIKPIWEDGVDPSRLPKEEVGDAA